MGGDFGTATLENCLALTKISSTVKQTNWDIFTQWNTMQSLKRQNIAAHSNINESQ